MVSLGDSNPVEIKKSSSAEDSSPLPRKASSNMLESDRLRMKFLKKVEDLNFTSDEILSHQDRKTNELAEMKKDYERLFEMYKWKLLKIEKDLLNHRREKEKWRCEKTELKMKLSALENELIAKDEELQTRERYANDQLQELREELIAKAEELQKHNEVKQTLINKERCANDQLQELRKKQIEKDEELQTRERCAKDQLQELRKELIAKAEELQKQNEVKQTQIKKECCANDQLQELRKKQIEKDEELQTLDAVKKQAFANDHLQELKKELIEKDEELQTPDAANDQLQELRKRLIELFKEKTSHQDQVIGVKQMGEMDCGSFKEAAKRKLCENGSEDRVSELCETWQKLLRNPLWLPFKTVRVEGTEDQHMEIVDSEDERLSELKIVLGDDACEILVTAINEMHEYNPSGRFPVSELWNFKEDRKATVKEVLACLNNQEKCFKRGRTR